MALNKRTQHPHHPLPLFPGAVAGDRCLSMPAWVPTLLSVSLPPTVPCPLGPALADVLSQRCPLQHPVVAGASPAFRDPLRLHCWGQHPALPRPRWQVREWPAAAQLGSKLPVTSEGGASGSGGAQ